MVEITYQMVLSTLQTVGLLIGIFYYIMTLRNAEKARELTLKSQKHAEDTRTIQLLLEINQYIQGTDQTGWRKLMNLEWTDFNDFLSKYGYENNPEMYNIRVGIWRNMSLSGLLIRDGLLGISTYVDYVGGVGPSMWNKYESIILELRKLYDQSELYYGIEFLAKETEKYRAKQGLKPMVGIG